MLFVLVSTLTYAKETKFEKRLQKDIKKLSRISGFIDNELKLYDEKTILDKKNTIIIICTKAINIFTTKKYFKI